MRIKNKTNICPVCGKDLLSGAIWTNDGYWYCGPWGCSWRTPMTSEENDYVNVTLTLLGKVGKL